MSRYLSSFYVKVAFLILYSLPSWGQIKQVEFDWNSPSIIWSDQVGYLPCKEAFNLKIIKAPAGTSKIVVRVYRSEGVKYKDVRPDVQLGRDYETNVAPGTDPIIFIPEKLPFHRYFYVEVVLTTTAMVTKEIKSGTATSNPTIDITTENSKPNISVTTKTETQTVTVNPASSSGPSTGPITTTTITTTTLTTETRRTNKTYAIPLKSEISSIQFLTGLTDVAFSQSEFKNLDHNVALVTGLKIKFYEVSTNPNIGRFGLYPRASRWSVVVGTVLSEVNYKTTRVEALPVGLKLLGGIDWEFSENLGITIGTVVGRQETNSKLTAIKPVVVGAVIGISFSTAIFQAWNKTLPASAAFSAGGENKK